VSIELYQVAVNTFLKGQDFPTPEEAADESVRRLLTSRSWRENKERCIQIQLTFRKRNTDA
jgi:hypothetical protein